ncbi:MAG: peptidase M61, partial [Kangiellaceae bacterium]|nr:peptidase M61 [Kangiellaceae bacterium]
MISYQISLIHPESHQIDVVLSIKSALVKGQEFWLPDWIPGSYMIRDFARNITSIFAFEQGNPVALTKLDKSTWCLDENVEGLEIRYKVYAWDLSVRAAHFDDQHCFFNGTSILLALKGAENQQHEIELLKPSHPCSVDWSVATTLKIRTVDSNGFGRYFADNYADAIDHPFEVAELDKVEFIVAGVTHRMVFTESPENIDYVRIAKDVAAICALECDFFADDKPPFKQYLFMTFVQKSGFGGLEHRSSTALQCSHADLPKIGDPEKKSED